MAMAGFLVVLMTLLFSVLGIVAYLVVSYSIYTMAKNRGIPNPWLAFVPIANLYIMAQLIQTLNIFGFEIPMFTMVFPLSAVVVGILGQVKVIGPLISLAYFIVSIAALNKLYRMYAPASATLYTILSLFGIPAIFILFMIRNNTPVEAA
jgi:hypothetical protein